MRRAVTTTPGTRLPRWAAVAVAAPLLLGACEYDGAGSLPLPGSVDEDEGYAITVEFEDAANLVAKETCRANDSVIGSVESVELTDDLTARVVCRIKHGTELPANVTGTIRETSLLGERFVSLDVPEGERPRGTLEPDTVIPASATRVDPDTEIVLGALSQVLNGSGLASVDTITRELNTALTGADARGTVEGLRDFVGTLNANRDSLTGMLESLDRFTGKLAAQRGVIGEALDALPDGLAVLDRQRPRLVRALQSLSRLSRTAVPLITDVRADTVAGLRHLAPVLTRLSEVGDELALTVERIVSWPFPHEALTAIKNDYGGMYGTISLDLESFEHLTETPGPPQPTTPPADEPAPELTPPDLEDLLELLEGTQLPDRNGTELLDDLIGGGS